MTTSIPSNRPAKPSYLQKCSPPERQKHFEDLFITSKKDWAKWTENQNPEKKICRPVLKRQNSTLSELDLNGLKPLTMPIL